MKNLKPAVGGLAMNAVIAAIATSVMAQTTMPPPTEPSQPAAPVLELAPVPVPPGDGLPPPVKVRRSGSVDYLNGGAGEESRAMIERLQSRFGVRNVFSGQGGEYVVAETVIVRGASGTVAEISNAGPILMIDLPPGKYTIEAAVNGKVQRKSVTVAKDPVKLNWNWPGA